RTDRVENGVVEPGELVVIEVAPHLDVAEEAEPRSRGDLLEGPGDGHQLWMIRGDTQPDEAPRRRQALDHVDLDARILARKQGASGVESRWARAHDRDAEISHGASCYDRLRHHDVRAS